MVPPCTLSHAHPRARLRRAIVTATPQQRAEHHEKYRLETRCSVDGQCTNVGKAPGFVTALQRKLCIGIRPERATAKRSAHPRHADCGAGQPTELALADGLQFQLLQLHALT
jgi:hypothetical protein